MTAPRTTLGAGSVVAGRYQITRLLGEGGYGSVYEAAQLNLGRVVALKIMRMDVVRRPEALRRFEQEARLAQQLAHPNIVRLFDFGRTDEGVPFTVWELMIGRSLEREIARAGALPGARVAHVAQQTLKALMEAHSLGIVHRDIKPANLFLSDFAGEPDFVKVLDFGIALAPSSGSGQSGGITAEGISLGTPAYMAPEQVMDQGVDARTDLYALGLVMAEMLTGEPVFRGATAMQVAMMQIDEQPAPLSDLVRSSPLGPIIVRATQKAASRRFTSAFEMLDVVRATAALLPSVHSAAPPVVLRAHQGATPSGVAFLPTVGTVTPPGAVAPTIDTGPPAFAPPVPDASTGPRVLAPKRRSRAWKGVLLGVAVLSAAAGGAALAAQYFAPAKAPREAAKQDDFDEEVDRALDDAWDLDLDGFELKIPGKEGFKVMSCSAAEAEMAEIDVSGVDGVTLLRRLEGLGYQCQTVTRLKLSGDLSFTFMLVGFGRQERLSMVAELRASGRSLRCVEGATARDPETGASLCIYNLKRKEAERVMQGVFGTH